MESLLIDFRHALRRLRKAPAGTAVSLTLLALGTGANLAVFTLVNTLYFKPLPVPEPGRLVHVLSQRPGGSGNTGFSYSEYDSLREHATAVPSLAAETSVAQLHLVSRRGVRELGGAFVTAEYFPLMGITAARGRVMQPATTPGPDQDKDHEAGIVISDRLWRLYFESDPDIPGTAVSVNGLQATIIGVAPPRFDGDEPGVDTEIWLPMAMLEASGWGCGSRPDCRPLDALVARLAPGRTIASARAELSAATAWSATRERDGRAARELLVLPATGTSPGFRSEFAPQVRLLAGVTAMLLLIVCFNLGGLTLARGIGRGKEIAVRLSLGATRARIIRQLMTESLVVSAIGTLLGLLVSVWATAVLSGFYTVGSEGFVRLFDFGLDDRAVAYSALLSLTIAILFGLAPAVQISRQRLITELEQYRGVTGSAPISGLRGALVVAQVALSLVLIVSSALLVRSSRTLLGGTNFDPANVVVLRLRPKLAKYDATRAAAFYGQVAARLASTAGVQSVGMMVGGEGLVWNWANGRETDVSVAGRVGAGGGAVTVPAQDVDAAYFQTLRIPILAGRAFTRADVSGSARVAIVNDSLARRLWPDATPEGPGTAVARTLRIDGEECQVVGVVATLQPRGDAMVPATHVYLPFWQARPGVAGDVRLAVRVTRDPVAILPMLRAEIRAIDPNVPLGEDMPMETQIALHYAPVMLARSVLTFCGLLAVGLSAVGLYSVLALAVRTRTREIGIRVALGASPRDVTRTFLDQATALGLWGVAGGLAMSWGATRLLSAWLYGVAARDTLTFAVSAIVLFATAIAAGYLPARRAARLDPIVALRHE